MLYSALGNSFTPSENGSITKVSFYVKRINNPIGNLIAYIYRATLVGSNYIPLDNPVGTGIIAESNLLDMEDLIAVYNLEEFTLTSPLPVTTDSVYVAQMVVHDATLLNEDNCVFILGWASTGNCTGNGSTYDADGGWVGRDIDLSLLVDAGVTRLYTCAEGIASGSLKDVHPPRILTIISSLPSVGIHGWDSDNEGYVKGKVDSDGILQTS